MAFNEMQDCCKGHENLSNKLRGENTNYVAARHRKRLLNDALGNGIVRGQIENTTLRVNGNYHAVTATERFRACGTEPFFGRAYVKVIERLNDHMTE